MAGMYFINVVAGLRMALGILEILKRDRSLGELLSQVLKGVFIVAGDFFTDENVESTVMPL